MRMANSTPKYTHARPADLHMISCVSRTFDMTGFLSEPSYLIIYNLVQFQVDTYAKGIYHGKHKMPFPINQLSVQFHYVDLCTEYRCLFTEESWIMLAKAVP